MGFLGFVMITYLVITCDGRNKHITTYTESDAREQAAKFAGDDGIKEFYPI